MKESMEKFLNDKKMIFYFYCINVAISLFGAIGSNTFEIKAFLIQMAHYLVIWVVFYFIIKIIYNLKYNVKN